MMAYGKEIPKEWKEGLEKDSHREEKAAEKPISKEEAYQEGVRKSREEERERQVNKAFEKGQYTGKTRKEKVRHWGQKVVTVGQNLGKVAAAFKPKPQAQPRYAKQPKRYARAPQVVYADNYGRRVRAPQPQRVRQPEPQRMGGIFGGGSEGFGMGNGMFGGGNQKAFEKKKRGGIFG
jgi:hypothetical protein